MGLNTIQLQPLPNCVKPLSFTFALKPAKSPNAALIASAIWPVGSPPAFGPMISQNSEWLWCPPPLLMTACLIPAGTLPIPRSSATMSRLARVRAASERLVEVVDVGFVVLLAVNFHRLGVDVRFERIERVGQCGKCVRHV